MGQINEKFKIIKQTIPTHPQQAREECDNGVSHCVEAVAAFANVKSKLNDAGVTPELQQELQAVVDEYLVTTP